VAGCPSFLRTDNKAENWAETEGLAETEVRAEREDRVVADHWEAKWLIW
jgi:hypothetical protein